MAITSPVVRQAKFLKAFSNLQTHTVKETWQDGHLKCKQVSTRDQMGSVLSVPDPMHTRLALTHALHGTMLLSSKNE